HRVECIAAGLLPEFDDATLVVGLEQTKFPCFCIAARIDRYRDIGAALEMPCEKVAIVHPVKMVARKYQQCIDTPISKVRQRLSHGVGRALKPVLALLGLFGGEHLDVTGRKARETVGPRNVAI